MLHSVKHGAWIFEKDSQKNEKGRFENSNSVHNFIMNFIMGYLKILLNILKY